MDTMPLHVVLDDAREFRIERGQDLIEHLDKGHVELAMDQVFHHLEADESTADHHRTRLGLHRLEAGVLVHPGEEQGTSLDPLTDRPSVRHGPDLKDSRKIDAGQGRTDGAAPGDNTSLS